MNELYFGSFLLFLQIKLKNCGFETAWNKFLSIIVLTANRAFFILERKKLKKKPNLTKYWSSRTTQVIEINKTFGAGINDYKKLGKA